MRSDTVASCLFIFCLLVGSQAASIRQAQDSLTTPTYFPDSSVAVLPTDTVHTTIHLSTQEVFKGAENPVVQPAVVSNEATTIAPPVEVASPDHNDEPSTTSAPAPSTATFVPTSLTSQQVTQVNTTASYIPSTSTSTSSSTSTASTSTSTASTSTASSSVSSVSSKTEEQITLECEDIEMKVALAKEVVSDYVSQIADGPDQRKILLACREQVEISKKLMEPHVATAPTMPAGVQTSLLQVRSSSQVKAVSQRLAKMAIQVKEHKVSSLINNLLDMMVDATANGKNPVESANTCLAAIDQALAAISDLPDKLAEAKKTVYELADIAAECDRRKCPRDSLGVVCSGVGECLNATAPSTTRTCKCPTGYTGLACQYTCPLVNGAVCNGHGDCAADETAKKAICRNCQAGWTKGNCEDVDECASAWLNDCPSTATCTNTAGSFTCKCQSGYVFNTYTRKCEDINECNSPSSNVCDSTNGFCVNTAGGYHCGCSVGYELISQGSCRAISDWTYSGVGAPIPKKYYLDRVGVQCPSNTVSTGFSFQRGGANINAFWTQGIMNFNTVTSDHPNKEGLFARSYCPQLYGGVSNAQWVLSGVGSPLIKWYYLDRVGGVCPSGYVAAGFTFQRGGYNQNTFWDSGNMVTTASDDDSMSGLFVKLYCVKPNSFSVGYGSWVETGVGSPMINAHYLDRVGGVCPPFHAVSGVRFVRGGAYADVKWYDKVLNYATVDDDSKHGLFMSLRCSRLTPTV
eukprot:GILI01002885.1.p1 GENE.GILI01002885.1~~GILI01002885.1.p1  ORF type:complete len:746 (+),score=251.37 GILI01002885.1:570-2807(+)